MELKNAMITGTKLSNEDHCVLSAWVYLDYGGSGQGFGGHALYNPDWKNAKDITGLFIWRVMEVAGVENWDSLKGKTIRVLGDSSHIEAIGHILKDIWFYPEKEFKAMLDK